MVSRKEMHVELLTHKEIKEWIEEVKSARTGSARTSEAYLDKISVFLPWTKMTPEEIVRKAFNEQKREAVADEPTRKTWAEKQTLDFFSELQKRGLARTSAKAYYGVVRSFFRYNGILFKSKTPSATVQTTYRLPVAEQLLKAWKVATPKQRLAVSIARSTGLRPSDMLGLVWRDLQFQYDPTRAYVEKVSNKEDLRFGTYLTMEATELVRIEMARRYPNSEIPADAKLLDCDYNALRDIVERFGKGANFTLSPKYFRKMFRTRCEPVIGMESVCKMAAWTLPGVGKNYFLPAPEQTHDLYTKIEPLLTFEQKAVTDKEQQIRNLLNVALAQGITVDEIRHIATVAREKTLSPEQVALIINEKRKMVKPAGGVSFEDKAAEMVYRIFKKAARKMEVRE